MNYLKEAAAQVANPPQSEPLNARQVKNSAGGHAYPVDCWKQLDRFLILGSEGGSYYASEQKLTKACLGAVIECCKTDGLRLVSRIVEISEAGRAPKNDPALLALAYAAAKGELAVRQAALAALPRVARIGTHLFHFVDFTRQFRGWGRAFKRGVAGWYESQSAERLASQVTKYQQRDGWSHASLLRLSHPNLSHPQDAIARWVLKVPCGPRELKDRGGKVVRKYGETGSAPALIEGHNKIQGCTNGKEAAALIREYGLVRENVPTELLAHSDVWDALLDRMPITALIRNLGNLSKNGVLKPLGSRVSETVAKLTDLKALKAGRVHPLQVLMALKTYQSGRGVRGKGEWTVVPQVVDALDSAYYMAFETFEGTGKRYYLGLDISGSMWGGAVAGIENFTPAIASGAMAMVTMHKEPAYYCAGFTANGGDWRVARHDSVMTPCSLTRGMRLDTVVEEMAKLSKFMGGTDCALPMLDALEKRLEVDVFCVYTDSETWAGKIHPSAALDTYRQKTGIPAKLVVVGMVANRFSIADPMDAGMLDVVGFDASTPAIIADFAKG
jgi:60 kDa SS-A/Ro ribonucleoprotein